MELLFIDETTFGAHVKWVKTFSYKYCEQSLLFGSWKQSYIPITTCIAIVGFKGLGKYSLVEGSAKATDVESILD